ncbi:MAG: DUF4389 domain-containing protein [Dehalococcoidia bacterium]|nr:DUF4389 domain-containing protein [Dehalococcoidia bacterium]
MQEAERYPVVLEVDYPERQSRWKTLLRLFLAIPLIIFLAILGGGSVASVGDTEGLRYSLGATGAVIIAIWAAIVVRGYIPRWLFNFEVAFLRFSTRVSSYFALLTDVYPPFEGDYPVRLEIDYPERLARWKVLIWKGITSIPHFIVLLFLGIAALFCVIIAWFAILITARFPQGLHRFVAGVFRWNTRVWGYFISLTDEYPPFSLSERAGPAGRDTYVISAVIGWLLTAGIVAGAITAAVIAGEETVGRVDYEALTAGEGGVTIERNDLGLSIIAAVDPADDELPLLRPEEGKRLVAFELELTNDRNNDVQIEESDFRLEDAEGDSREPLLTLVGGRVAPADVEEDETGEITLVFEVERGVGLEELRFRGPLGTRLTFEFE